MIGRKYEKNELEQLYNSNKPELVAVYGRRRVGKTYLINEVLEKYFAFKHTGLSPAEGGKKVSNQDQLKHFYTSLKEYGMQQNTIPKDWLEAFFMLKNLLKEKDNGTRQVVFIDELPWLDTPQSGFITGFESFWNGWGNARKNLMVIVCGSAASWMQDKLINNYGGLYGRVTYEIYLQQFTLKETEEFFAENGVEFSRYDIVQSYMICGGIPYYLNYFTKQYSLGQNIDNLFFKKHAKLEDEYRRLFMSVFTNPLQIMSIVELLNGRRMGFTRGEIAEKLGISNGGALTENLNSLLAGDFVVKYVPFGYKKNQKYYKLIDPFCLFYLKFVKNRDSVSDGYWEERITSHELTSWRGLAFENVCFMHIKQIKNALQITGIQSEESAWSIKEDGDEDGMQIDMLIDRADNVVNLCEMKFYSDEAKVNNDYYMVMNRRNAAVSKIVPRKKTVRNTLITTYGLSYGKYSGAFTNVLTMDDLFSD